MRILILFNLLWLLAASQLAAQNQDSLAIKKYYEENAILWLGKSKYFKNNQSYPLKNLKNEIKFSLDAKYELAQYRRNRKLLIGSLIVTEALAISSIIVTDPRAKVGLLAGSLIGLSIAIPASSKSFTHLSKSIWLHNRDILLR